MADIAFGIIDSLHLPHRQELALRWIAQDRLDGKQKGLAWLERDPPDNSRLIRILSRSSYTIKYPPYRHESRTTREGSRPGATIHVDGPEALIRKYYLRLFRLMGQGGVDSGLMRNASLNRDTRILFSLLLLRSGNGCCVAPLFDSYYIDTWYNAHLHPRYDTYLNLFPATVPRPFQSLTDSLLLQARLTGLPSFDSLLRSSRLADSTQLPASYISLMLHNYPDADLSAFDRHMTGLALPLALYDYLHGKDVRPRLPLIISHQSGFEDLLRSDTIMNERLPIAWLLAHTGDPLAAQVATEAAKVVEKSFLFLTTTPTPVARRRS
ncbi:hypothetical protein ACQ86N_01545 [Puia sp. P3]|uniref:hypothetical protein n=1 Tax=Puia sp. P3 TaxID=3423952 RepID=UPI003D66CF1B